MSFNSRDKASGSSEAMILEVENMNDKIIFKKTNTENKDEVDIVRCRGTRFLLD